MKPITVIHMGTSVTVGRFETRAQAQYWLDQLGVTPSYKEQFYRIVGTD